MVVPNIVVFTVASVPVLIVVPLISTVDDVIPILMSVKVSVSLVPTLIVFALILLVIVSLDPVLIVVPLIFVVVV